MDEIVSEGEISAACSKVAGEAVPAQGSRALEVAGLQAWYGDRHVLKDVSLTARTGRILAIIGPSGCGKSTFLKVFPMFWRQTQNVKQFSVCPVQLFM